MELTPDLGSNAKLAKKCSAPGRKMGATTIATLIDEESGSQPQLDTIEAVAEAFKLPAWVLLTEHFNPDTRTVAGVPPTKLLEFAQRLAPLPVEKRDLLLEVLSTRSGITTSSAEDTGELMMHDAAAHYGSDDRRRGERRRPDK